MKEIVKFKFALKGISPLLMHNSQLADPINPFIVKMRTVHNKMAKKRTDADYENLRRWEWEGGLYLDADRRIVIPSNNIEALLVDSFAAERKRGAAQSGILCEADAFPLQYDGPKDIDALYQKREFVFRCPAKNGTSTVMRTRPRFNTWSLEGEITVVTEVVNPGEVRERMEYGGRRLGIGDWTPKHGRFTLTEWKEIA